MPFSLPLFIIAVCVGGVFALIFYLVSGEPVGAAVGYFIGAFLCLLVSWYIIKGKEETYKETHKEEIEKRQLELQERDERLGKEYVEFVEKHKKEERKFKPFYTYETDKHDLSKTIYKRVGKDKIHLVFYTSILPSQHTEWSQGTYYIDKVIPGEIIIDRKIPLDDIVYFESTGDVSFTSHNYGGGSSIGGCNNWRLACG